MELKKYTRLSLLIALSVILSLIESLVPIFNSYIPGLKLGLANIIILFVLYKYTLKDCIYVSIIRVVIVGILRTGIFSISFWFSLSGAIFSILMMYLSKRITNLSIIGISIIGSAFHSFGQIVVAIIFIKNINIVYYLPLLLLFSIPTGIVTGIVSKEVIKFLEN